MRRCYMQLAPENTVNTCSDGACMTRVADGEGHEERFLWEAEGVEDWRKSSEWSAQRQLRRPTVIW